MESGTEKDDALLDTSLVVILTNETYESFLEGNRRFIDDYAKLSTSKEF